jgi:TDG/mug DNA glycosylase family protein
VIASGLRVLFCGINPSLYSAAVGCHFGRPGNRSWSVLHASGFTPRRPAPSEQRELLDLDCGITNVVARTTARSDELTDAEIVVGGRALRSRSPPHPGAGRAFAAVQLLSAAFRLLPSSHLPMHPCTIER